MVPRCQGERVGEQVFRGNRKKKREGGLVT